MLEERKCKQAQVSTENIINKKIAITSERLAHLTKLKEETADPDEQAGALRVLVVNALNDVVALLAKEKLIGAVVVEALDQNNWRNVAKANSPKADVDLVVLEISETDLTAVDKSVLALSFMSSRPALVLLRKELDATQQAEFAKQVSRYTGGTWPIFKDPAAVVQYVVRELPLKLTLKRIIEAEVVKTVEHYKNVNKVKHFISRGAVAWVPFGVHTMNFIALLRLVARIMRDTGMRADTEVNKVLGGLGAIATAKTTAIDSIGDVYQTVIAATIITSMMEAFIAGGADAALATLDAVDVALLGSVSVLTGALAAWGAYLSRPTLVDSIGKFIAMLQVHAVLNPSMRRKQEEGAKGGASEEVYYNIDDSDEDPLDDREAAGAAAASQGLDGPPQLVRAFGRGQGAYDASADLAVAHDAATQR